MKIQLTRNDKKYQISWEILFNLTPLKIKYIQKGDEINIDRQYKRIKL